MGTFDCSDKVFEIALRVLSEWNQHREPNPSDIAALREAFPAFVHAQPDEIACFVVQELTPGIAQQRARRRPRP
jgi:hypothetical protein